jgi:lysophospholipase L1-like esterase
MVMSRARFWIAALLLWSVVANLWAGGGESGRYNMLALGTSLTTRYSWPQLLAEQLGRCLGTTIQMEVLARAGENSSRAIAQFEIRKHRRPDIVLVEYATNDADLLDGISLVDSRINHARLLMRIHDESPKSIIVLMMMSPAFGVRGWLRPQLNEYYEMYRGFDDTKQTISVDIRIAWQSFLRGPSAQGSFPDGLHPTEVATNRVLIPVLLPLLGRLLTGDPKVDCDRF